MHVNNWKLLQTKLKFNKIFQCGFVTFYLPLMLFQALEGPVPVRCDSDGSPLASGAPGKARAPLAGAGSATATLCRHGLLPPSAPALPLLWPHSDTHQHWTVSSAALTFLFSHSSSESGSWLFSYSRTPGVPRPAHDLLLRRLVPYSARTHKDSASDRGTSPCTYGWEKSLWLD